LLQTIRPHQEAFKIQIRSTAPDFRPYKANVADEEVFNPPSFLSNEEHTFLVTSEQNAIFIDEVMALALQAQTRELPDNYPFVVSKQLINDCTKLWDEPSHILFETVNGVLSDFVDELVDKHFGEHRQGGLYQRVMVIVNDVLKQCYDKTLSYIDWLLRLEQSPFTLNGHYFSDYKDKFLSHYRGSRQKGQNGELMGVLEASAKGHANDSISRLMGGLSELGLSGTTPMDIPKLLPSDRYEPALQIMAGVRAYFQVAYKRFADNVPMAIDQELLRGLDWDRGIQEALFKGLGVGGPDGQRRCEDLLKEPPNVSARRADLLKKQKRLETAKMELMNLF